MNEVDHFEWLENIYFHAWHFVYQQVQLTNWFGNIVAGVVTFVVLTIVWPRFRHIVERAIGVKALHAKLDAQHKERMDQAESHHQEALAVAREHHAAHMAALQPAPEVPAPKPATRPRTRKAPAK